MRIAIGKKQYLIRENKDYHTEYGVITRNELQNNSTITNTGERFTLAEPMFIDKWHKIKRSAQMPLLKDIAGIIAFTGVGKESTIVDAGAGSGGLALFLAHIVKHVYTYDVREDHCAIVAKNVAYLGLNNVTIQCKDITTGVDEQNVDLFTLDVAEPWKCMHTLSAVRLGGYVVSYSPNLTQVQEFVLAVNNCDFLVVEKTIEIVERDWKISDRVMKPSGGPHSGFLTFCRRVQAINS